MSGSKLATLMKLHVGLDNDGFIRIKLDKIRPIQLKAVFDEDLPDWDDSDLIVRYTEYVQSEIDRVLLESENRFNLRNVF
tara:strand:- start:391 stop:630 length:240 start_codon:yes stop_codon:yes gene_type:complete